MYIHNRLSQLSNFHSNRAKLMDDLTGAFIVGGFRGSDPQVNPFLLLKAKPAENTLKIIEKLTKIQRPPNSFSSFVHE